MTKLNRYGGVAGLVVLTTLAACGGGGGGSDSGTPPPGGGGNPPPSNTNTAPAITTQPANVTVTAGAKATFTVAATGTPTPTYQWQRNGQNIAGATSATYEIPATATTDNGAKFKVVITNSAGTVTSNEVTLTVNAAQGGAIPSVTTPPASATIVEGANLSITVGVGGGAGPYTYQWQKAPASSQTFTNISGATAGTLTLNNVPVSDNGAQYRVQVSNAAGAATSPAATVNVIAQGVRIIAGDPATQKGSLDGNGTAARFSFPANIATDAAGNVYVADFANQTIRMITPAGAVTTLAGHDYTQGYANGVGVNARFNNPVAVAVIGTTLYVADQSNNRIRTIDLASADKTVGTLAGSGTAGIVDGTGAAAAFNSPTGLHASGQYLYVSDFGNNRIRRVDTTTGAVVTVAGAGPAGGTDGAWNLATFNGPTDVAVNPGATAAPTDDIVYVADSNNNTIRSLNTATNVVSTIAGTAGQFGSTDAVGAAARFLSPRALELVGTNLYVAEAGNHTIRGIDLNTNTVTTVAGTAQLVGATSGAGAAARFKMPFGLAANPAGTVLYVSNFGNDTINTLTLAGAAVNVAFAGNPTARGLVDNAVGTNARFDYPRSITTDANGVTWVADSMNNAIRKVEPNGAVSTYAGDPARTGGFENGTRLAARFNDPRAVAVDASGNLYVADRSNDMIRRVDATTGAVTTLADNAKGVDRPDALVVADDGNVYVANSGAHTILKIVPSTGTTTVLAGAAGQAQYVDGAGATARFNFPIGIAARGNTLYVADNFNYRVRAIDIPTATVSTLAGDGTYGYNNNANGALAKFRSPGPLVVDGPGNYIYMVDYLSNTLRRIQIGGTHAVTTIAGVDDVYGVKSGNLPGGLNGPTGVSFMPGVAAGTRLRVSDGLEHVLLEVTTSAP